MAPACVPVRQSGFHGAHGVEGGLHGEFPRGVVLAALLMSEQQQATKFFTPGGQQGCKERHMVSRHTQTPTAPFPDRVFMMLVLLLGDGLCVLNYEMG